GFEEAEPQWDGDALFLLAAWAVTGGGGDGGVEAGFASLAEKHRGSFDRGGGDARGLSVACIDTNSLFPMRRKFLTGRSALRDHDLARLRGRQAGIEDRDQPERDSAAEELHDDVGGDRGGGDAGEGVAKQAADVERGVGEAGRAGEEVGGADVAAARRRGAGAPAGAGQGEDH